MQQRRNPNACFVMMIFIGFSKWFGNTYVATHNQN